MDYYNFNSGFTDSLDFLNPAAQKNVRLSRREFSPEYRCGDVLYTRKRTCVDQGCQKPSPTSLILKRTRVREVEEQNCCEHLRYRPCPRPKLSKPIQNPKNRPLIRVTVIPNNNTYTPTKLRKRKTSVKKIQSTVSNHESFFKAKNIFLVIGGNRREKIYEIKNTGSEYSNGARFAKHEEIPLEQNFQQLLNSLNMDKKKKKDKGKAKKEKDKKKDDDDRFDEQDYGASLMNNIEIDSPTGSSLRDCMCPPPINTVSPRKSRVTITGRIGRTEDDRYVLRCNATIDGKPIESNFYPDQNVSPPEWKAQEPKPQEMKEIPRMSNFCSCIPCPRERVSYCQRETFTETPAVKVTQRDEIVQTAFQFEDSIRQMPCPAYMKPCPAYTTPCPAFRSVETQYSPRNVNTVCFSNVEKLNIYSSKDEVVQCNCPPDLLAVSKDIGIEADYEVNSPKSCNSPLVIISVYPKPDSDDKYNDETSSSKDSNIHPPLKEKSSPIKKGVKKKQDKKSRPGSPTPPKSPVKGKEEKKVEKTKEKGKDKVDKNKHAKGNKKGPKKEKPKRDEKEKIEIETKTPDKQQSTKEFGISFNRCAECCMGCIGSRNRQLIQESTQMNRKRVMNWVSAKNDVSNVAINIDGENEFYDVLLRQGDITTDLQVRKTIKDSKYPQGPVDSGSLENFLLVNGDLTRTRNRSFSQTNFCDQRFADNTQMDSSIPRLNVRDSIEICHRREEKNSCNSVTFTTSASSSTSSKLAPVKHFKGDSCNLPNPVARDKEIRELLGIEKVKVKPSRTYQECAAKPETDYNSSLHCIYRRQRKDNVSTIHNIYEMRQLYIDDDDIQATHSDDDHYPSDDFGGGNYYNYDAQGNIDSCQDSDIIAQKLERASVAYGCELRDRCPNKNVVCEESSDETRRNTKPSKLFNKLSRNYESGDKTVSQVPRISSKSKYKNICVPSIDKEPCGAIVQCPYKIPNEESLSAEEEEQLHPESFNEEEEQQFTPEEEVQEKSQQQNQNAPLYQQVILNRNINIYLQIEQFTKQKPITLSRKQYDKVKRTIESATANRSSGKVMCICKPQSRDLKKRSSNEKKKSLRKTSGTTISKKPSYTRINSPKISKKPSGLKISSPKMSKKSSDTKKGTTKISKKSKGKVICECGTQDKEIKNIYHRETQQDEGCSTSKSKCSKHKLAHFYGSPNTPNSDVCCTNEVNFVGLDNRRKIHEVLCIPSRAFLLDAHAHEIPTQTNQSKIFAEGLINKMLFTKQCNDTIEEQTRNTHVKNKTYKDMENNSQYCKLISPKVDEDVYDEDKSHRKIKLIKSVKENFKNIAETQSRNTKPSKKDKKGNKHKFENKQSRKTKQLKRYADIGDYDEEQKNQSQRVKENKTSISICETTNENKQDSRKKSNNCGEGESIEKKGNMTGYWKGERDESVNNKPQPVFYQEGQTADISRDQFCKRCGRLKPSGRNGRLNSRRLQTCYCCEFNEKRPESPIENIYLDSCFVNDRQYAASSTEVRYTSVIYANYKHVTFSSMNVADKNVSLENPYVTNPIPKDYNSNSLHTIFKRRQRTPTPNLGTSAYSLCSTVATTAAKAGTPCQPVQERKPFLRRLMSCLVMRSKTSGVKIDVKPAAPKWNSANSSLDSYHINTSLGAVELSSSIYDTSASFYSNHSIQPINSKIIKRGGFLSSVRGFLTNRKV